MTWLNIYLMAHCACAGFIVGNMVARDGGLVPFRWWDYAIASVIAPLLMVAPASFWFLELLFLGRRRAREAAAKRVPFVPLDGTRVVWTDLQERES